MDYKPSDAMLYYFEWEEALEELNDHEYRLMIQAMQKYAKTGEKPEFSDRTMRATFKLILKAIDRNTERYERRCESNRQNGKKGGAPKGNNNAKKQQNNPNNRTVEKTTETTQNNPKQPKTSETTLPERDPDPDRERERERVPEREPERDAADAAKSALTREAASAAPAEFSKWEKEQIVTEWNTNKTTKNIFRIDPMSARSDNALACVELVGFEKFIEVIGSADNQGFFQKRFQNGKPITFDWFVKPENFTKVIEGNYAEEWSDDGLVVHEGWEVV